MSGVLLYIVDSSMFTMENITHTKNVIISLAGNVTK
jgi:hypothetical protein